MAQLIGRVSNQDYDVKIACIEFYCGIGKAKFRACKKKLDIKGEYYWYSSILSLSTFASIVPALMKPH